MKNKQRIKSKADDVNTRLVEAVFGDISVILCYRCYKNRCKGIAWDKSIYKRKWRAQDPLSSYVSTRIFEGCYLCRL